MSNSTSPYGGRSASSSTSLASSSRTSPASPTAQPAANPSRSSWLYAGHSHRRLESKSAPHGDCLFCDRSLDISERLSPLQRSLPIAYSGQPQHRHVPHIYADEEIHALLDATTGLRPRDGLRARSVGTYLSLMLCTGMSPQEPLRLTRADVDFHSHTITVRQ